MSRRATLGAAVGALALVAAGCGGSRQVDGVPAQEWAGSLCTSVSDWTGALTGAATRLRSPDRLTANGFRGAVRSVIDATRRFVEEVGALGVPATEAGEQTQTELRQLQDVLQTGADSLAEELDSAGSGLPGLLTRLSAITSSLSDLRSAAGRAFDRISNLDGAQELEDAFQRADACQELGPTR